MKINLLKTISISLIASSLFFSVPLFAKNGGQIGRSGNPATPLDNPGVDCNLCHTGGIAPEVLFKGPLVVEVGKTYSYQLIMSGGQKINGGFNVSVDGGVLKRTSGRARLVASDVAGLPDELTQSGALNVSTDGTGTLAWKYDWTAPDVAGTTIMYGAVMSGDKLNGADGDKASSTNIKIVVSATPPKPTPPVAVITAPKSAAMNSATTFSGMNSSDADNGIKSYSWVFSDGGTHTGDTAEHTFKTVGNHTATLTVTDNGDLTSSTFVDITIVDTANGSGLYPVAIITAASRGTAAKAMDFNADQSFVAGATNPSLRYLWDFGDAKTIATATSQAVTSHTFDSAGTYVVRLVVLDDVNLMGIVTKTVVIGAEITEPVIPVIPVVDTPEKIYNTNCAACHGVAGVGINGTGKPIKGATKLLIDNAIATGLATSVAEMSTIQLPAADMQQVADYLGTSVDQTGPELFASRCELCHGVAGVGATAKVITGATVLQIDNAIAPASATAVPLMAGIKLTAAETTSIEGFLAVDVPVGATGKELYDATCLQCHGLDGTGGSAKLILNRTLADIKAAYANVNIPEMQAITVLTDAEIQLVADFLVKAVPGDVVAGEQTFIAKCQKCHGTGTGGYAVPILNASEQMITDVIAQTSVLAVPVMSTIVLTADEKLNLVAFLAGGGLMKPTNGNDLYVMYCSNCHDKNGIGSYIRSSGIKASTITRAMNGGERIMTNSYLSKILTPADIKLIANSL